MAELKPTDSKKLLDYMARDYDSLLHSMRGVIPKKLPEWTDYTSEADFGNALIEMFAHMGDIISYYQDRIVNESFLGTARERRSIIQHLRLIGYSLSTAAPAATKLTIVVPVSKSGEFRLRRGDAFATKSTKEKPSVHFEYNGKDSTVNLNNFVADTLDINKKIYTIPIEQGTLIKEDIIGVSDGSPNQRFVLNHTPIILRSFEGGAQTSPDIEIKSVLGSDIQLWKQQETLAFSRERQHDYAIEINELDQALIMFGDDTLLGAIPPLGAVIKATYRIGGGLNGNVPAGAIVSIADAPALSLLAAKVENREAATGGAERESIDHAIMHAPEIYRSNRRAVTGSDFKALALKFKGVGKVRAESNSWNTVVLYVAPEGGGMVSDVLRANLQAYFEDKRPLSTIIEIENVDYVKIYITAEVAVKSYYSQADVRTEVLQAASHLLEFEQVDFAEKIYLSKFYEAIEDVEGVEYATITEFRREGIPDEDDDSGKIALRESEVPRTPNDTADDPKYVDGIAIEISGGYI